MAVLTESQYNELLGDLASQDKERCVMPRSVYGAQGDRLFTQKNRLSLTKSRLLSSKPTNEPLRNKPGAGVFEPEPELVVSLLDTDTEEEQLYPSQRYNDSHQKNPSTLYPTVNFRQFDDVYAEGHQADGPRDQTAAPEAAPALANSLAPALAPGLLPRGLAELALPLPMAPKRQKAPEDLRFEPVTPPPSPRPPFATAFVATTQQRGVQPVDTVREQDDKVLTGGTRKRQAAGPVQAVTRGGIKVRNGATVAIELISADLKLMNEDEVHGHGLTKKEKILERRRLERMNKT